MKSGAASPTLASLSSTVRPLVPKAVVKEVLRVVYYRTTSTGARSRTRVEY